MRRRVIKLLGFSLEPADPFRLRQPDSGTDSVVRCGGPDAVPASTAIADVVDRSTGSTSRLRLLLPVGWWLDTWLAGWLAGCY